MPSNLDNCLWEEIVRIFKMVGEGETFDKKAHDKRLSMLSMKEIFGDSYSYYRIRKVMRQMKSQGFLYSVSHRYGWGKFKKVEDYS